MRSRCYGPMPVALAVAFAAACVRSPYQPTALTNPGASVHAPISLSPEVAIRARGCRAARYRRAFDYEATRSHAEISDWQGTRPEDSQEASAPDSALDGLAVRGATLSLTARFHGASVWVPRRREDQGSALAVLSATVGVLAGLPIAARFGGTMSVRGEAVSVVALAPCPATVASAGGAQ